MTYAHDAHCNVIHDGPEPCPPACSHEWNVAALSGSFRICAKCQSVVNMAGSGLTLHGWIGDQPERVGRIPR